MRFRFFLTLVMVLLAGAAMAAAAQQSSPKQQDEVLDEFMGTRGAGFGAPDTPKSGGPKKTANPGNTKSGTTASASKNTGAKGTERSRPQQQAGTNGPKKSGVNKGAAATPDVMVTSGNTSANNGVKADTTVKASSVSQFKGAIGLGYTLYMKDAQGDGVRVDPAREFNEGDSIRIGLETNTDGYLYVFHTENGRNAQLLFPNADLDGGSNRLSAHDLETVPSNAWFTFDPNPAIERLYIVVSREPLAGVPTGAALVDSCRGKASPCFWKPTAEIWQRITASASGRVVESHSEVAQVKAPADTMKRGFTITKAEPAPTVVRMNASSTSGTLVTTIDLVHK